LKALKVSSDWWARTGKSPSTIYASSELRSLSGPQFTAVDLQQLPLPDQIADRHRLKAERLRLAPAVGLIPVFCNSTSSGNLAIGLKIRLALSLVSRLSERAFAPSGWP